MNNGNSDSSKKPCVHWYNIADCYNGIITIYYNTVQENYTCAQRIFRGQKAGKRTQKASTSIKGANLLTSQNKLNLQGRILIRSPK